MNSRQRFPFLKTEPLGAFPHKTVLESLAFNALSLYTLLCKQKAGNENS